MDGCVSASVTVLDTLTGTHEHWKERNRSQFGSSTVFLHSPGYFILLLTGKSEFSPLDFWFWVEVYAAVTVQLCPTTALPKWIYWF